MSFHENSPLQLGLVLEQSLGHTTHAQNLKRALENRSDIRPSYVDLPYHNMPGAWARLPGIRSNWSLRASLGAYLALRPQARALQAVLFHTQVTSLFSAGLMRRVPSVISLDATPLQFDAMGEFYGHSPSSNTRLEAIKKRLNIRAFTAAQHLVTWSQWAKDSLVTDYGMPADKITVIPPGIDMREWGFERDKARSDQPLHLLFVGGDFVRKGGNVLLEAFRRLPPSVNAILHLVTNAPEAPEGRPNICVYRNVKPNSSQMLQLYRQAEIFVFPTYADCLGLVVLEAMAAGLPVISTTVGALPEAIVHGETGWNVPTGDPDALANAIAALAADPALRAQMGRRGREAAMERFDATTNFRRLVDVVKNVAH